MAEILEIRWHGRGGQGAVTAAKFLAEVALAEGKYIQGFPEYGPERMGAPLKAFTRISEQPIVIHSQVYHPRIVVVIDPTLIGPVDVTEGLLSPGTVLVNSSFSPADIRGKMTGTDGEFKVFTVDATQIALDEMGRDIPNMPMLGALVKATGVASIDKVVDLFKEEFAGKFTPKVIEGNVKAIRRAYEEVKGE